MSDLDLDDPQRLDRQAMLVCKGYEIEGIPAFLIRCTEDGNTRIIGPAVRVEGWRASVVKMLRSAADGYETQPFEYDN